MLNPSGYLLCGLSRLTCKIVSKGTSNAVAALARY